MRPSRSRHLAACAVVVLLAGCGHHAAPAAKPAPPVRTTTPPRLSDWLDRLPVGPPPTLGYVIGHWYHSADGRMLALPRDTGVTAITRLGDGYLVVDDRSWEGTAGIFVLDARGRRVGATHTISGAPALSRDGTTLRWITFTPLEVSRSEREPSMLHVADVATGEIRSRVIHPDVDALPRVAQPDPRPDVDAVLGRFGSAVWLRASTVGTAWEDAHHLLLAVRPRGSRAAVVRLDTRSGAWTLAVDLMPLEGSGGVAFETRR